MLLCPDMQANGRICLLHFSVCAFIVAFSASYRFVHPRFARAYDTDELITLRYYTYAGTMASGEARELRRRGDIANLSLPGLGDLAVGCYCSLGRWAEPNNHIVNSFLINWSMLLPVSRERAVRFPALMGAVVLAMGMAWICCFESNWNSVSSVVTVICFWNPYVVAFSQSARGYTWMLALQILMIILHMRLIRYPRSVVIGAALGICAILSIVNVVSMFIHWVIPFYLAFRVWGNGNTLCFIREPAELVTLRYNLLAQILATGSAVFIFFADRLPYLVSSARQYGLVFTSYSAMSGILVEVGGSLFPSLLWSLWGSLGVIGLLFLWRQPGLGAAKHIFLFSLLALCIDLIFSRRIPYPRTCGFLLPAVMVGFSAGLHAIYCLISLPTFRAFFWICVFTLCMAMACSCSDLPTVDITISEFESHLSSIPKREENIYPILGKNVSDTIELSFPREWRDFDWELSPGSPTSVVVITKSMGTMRESPVLYDVSSMEWHPLRWSSRELLVEIFPYRAVQLVGSATSFRPDDRLPEQALIFWYPAFRSVAVSPVAVLRMLDESDVVYVPRYTRYHAKLEVFSKLHVVVFPIDRELGTFAAGHVIAQAMKRFGGHAVVFLPLTSDPKLPAPVGK